MSSFYISDIKILYLAGKNTIRGVHNSMLISINNYYKKKTQIVGNKRLL